MYETMINFYKKFSDFKEKVKMSNNNGDSVPLRQPIVDSWCRTKDDEEVSFKFAWTIENFSKCQQQTGEFLSSSKFTISVADNIETHWQLKLYPNGECYQRRNFLSLHLISLNKADVNVKYSFSILDSDKNIHEPSKINYSSVFTTKTEWCPNERGDSKFIGLPALRSQSSQLLPNDSLTIVCDITILGRHRITESISFRHPEADQSARLDRLSKDIGWNAFTLGAFSDVQLQCGDQVYNCHQVILSARSPVFRAMFMADMAEKKTQKVDIKDMTPDVLYAMLIYIYEATLPSQEKFDQFGKDLLAAADQYQLDQLKCACADYLSRNLDIENCVSYLILGDLYQEDVLKKAALQFIARNMKNVLKTKDWKESLQNKPSLKLEAFEAFEVTEG